MYVQRPAEARGSSNFGWLQSRFTFSFADYFDPQHMGFGPLRVINDDHIAAGGGFPLHPHRNMEIITYVLTGALEHQDSMGNGSVIYPHDVQRMSAGKGVRHSEFNPSKEEGVHLLQIWIEPDATGYPPSYEQKHFPRTEKLGRFRLIASPTGENGSVTIHQDAFLFAAILTEGHQEATYEVKPERALWIHVATGTVSCLGVDLSAGDGLAVRDEDLLSFVTEGAAEILLFDLPIQS